MTSADSKTRADLEAELAHLRARLMAPLIREETPAGDAARHEAKAALKALAARMAVFTASMEGSDSPIPRLVGTTAQGCENRTHEPEPDAGSIAFRILALLEQNRTGQNQMDNNEGSGEA